MDGRWLESCSGQLSLVTSEKHLSAECCMHQFIPLHSCDYLCKILIDLNKQLYDTPTFYSYF